MNFALRHWQRLFALLLMTILIAAELCAQTLRPAAAAEAKGDVQNGQRLYTADGCYQCHGRAAQGGAAGPRLAPDAVTLPRLTQYVRRPTGNMPPYTSKVVSDAELADVFAFLQSLPKPPAPSTIPILAR